MFKLANGILFFVRLKCQRSTIILSFSIKYSTCDLICDVNYPQSSDVRHKVLMTSALQYRDGLP